MSALSNANLQNAPSERQLQSQSPQSKTRSRGRTSAKNDTHVNKTGLPDLLKRQYESMSGLSMDDVRVHYNSGRPARLDALAYTQGNQIYVAPGQERHLGHELGHVVQQKRGQVRPTASMEGFAVNLDEGLEREADALERQAKTYRTHGGGEPERPSSKRQPESGGVAQLRPIEDRERRYPFYVDSRYRQVGKPRFLLKYFVEMSRYVAFQIRDHVRRIFWEKDQMWIEERGRSNPDSQSEASPVSGEEVSKSEASKRGPREDKYYTDRNLTEEFPIDDFMKTQPLDAWLESYEEAEGAIRQIDASDMEAAEKDRQRTAIMNYTFQRYIVNALYRAEELQRMEYSGSPLSYQDRSTYMRSGAGSFADAWKEVLRGAEGNREDDKARLILTRSAGMRQELDKFFYTLRLENEADSVEELRWQLSGSEVISKIAAFIEKLQTPGAQKQQDTAFKKQLEEAEIPPIFADMTEEMENLPPQEQLEKMHKIGQRLRDAVFLETASRILPSPQDAEQALWLNQLPEGKAGRIVALDERLRQDADRQVFWRECIEFLQAERKNLDSLIEEIRQQLSELQGEKVAQLSESQRKDNAKMEDKLQKQLEGRGEQRQLLEHKIQAMQDFCQRNEENFEVAANADAAFGDAANQYIEYMKKQQEQLNILFRNIGYIATTGGMVSLEAGGVRQSALLFADAQMDRLIKVAVNKAGYVPSITEALRSMMQYRKEDGSSFSIQEIAQRVFDKQKQREPVKDDGRKEAMNAAAERIDHLSASGKPQYAASDAEAARRLAQTGFALFCSKLAHSRDANVVQASAVRKLIDASGLFANPNIPAFVWYQLEYYLDAALHSENHLVDFTRNIQGIHEIILLGIELSGKLSRGIEFELPMAAQLLDSGNANDPNGRPGQEPPAKLYQGAYLADYGLKAFAQVYDAAAAQHAQKQAASADGGSPLQIAAFYNIYFELTEKLNATRGADPRRVHMETPTSVEDFLSRMSKPDFRLPDIIMIDIHPNDATRESIAANDICLLLEKINQYREDWDCCKQITVIVDITLNQAMDDEVQGIIKGSREWIGQGWLNLVFVQSLTKFAQMGMDKHSGGLVFAYNHESRWKEFNESLKAGREADPVDPYMQEYFRLLFANAGEEQREYIRIIRENTRYVQDTLSQMLADTAIQLSVNEDAGSCYVAWHYRRAYKQIRYARWSSQNPGSSKEPESSDLPKLPYTLHEFNIAILEEGINRRMSNARLPVAMRFSFGFPLSNLGETGDEVRFTIGMETQDELMAYMQIIRDVAKAVQDRIDRLLREKGKDFDRKEFSDIGKFKEFLQQL